MIDVTCPVCQQVLIRPMLTPCGHFGCFRCLFTYVTTIKQCPVCAIDIIVSTLCRSTLMNQLLKDQVSLMSARSQSAYFRRFLLDAAWNQRRKVSNPCIGCPVDVADLSGDWRPAFVIGIHNQGSKTYLMVKSKQFDQNPLILPTSSLRLATRGEVILVGAEQPPNAMLTVFPTFNSGKKNNNSNIQFSWLPKDFQSEKKAEAPEEMPERLVNTKLNELRLK